MLIVLTDFKTGNESDLKEVITLNARELQKRIKGMNGVATKMSQIKWEKIISSR